METVKDAAIIRTVQNPAAIILDKKVVPDTKKVRNVLVIRKLRNVTVTRKARNVLVIKKVRNVLVIRTAKNVLVIRMVRNVLVTRKVRNLAVVNTRIVQSPAVTTTLLHRNKLSFA